MIPTLAADPVEHVVDKPLVHVDLFGYKPEWFISNVTVMLIAGGIVTLMIMLPAAKNIMTGPNKTIDDYRAKGMLANLVEVVCLYLRDGIFKPTLQDEADRFTPFLWTAFWFILICNLMGLIPIADAFTLVSKLTGKDIGLHHGHGIGGTATQSIYVTGAMAFLAFLVINVSGFLKDPVGYFKHLTGGAPWWMLPIMIPVELLGIFVKPFALAVRLFANMTGGHLVIAVLLSFVYALIAKFGTILGGGFALVPLAGVTAIYFLEVFVAFIQAFVFTFLTTIFIGQLVAHPHHAEHHAEHGHDHKHDHAGHSHAH